MVFKNIFLLFCLFIFIFNIKINFPPYYMNLVWAFLGFLFLFIKTSDGLFVSRNLFQFFIVMLFIPFSFCISLLFNSEFDDLYYLRTFFLNNIIYFLSALFIVSAFFKEKSYEDYVKYLALAVSIQLILSLIAYLIPSFFDFVFKLIAMERDVETLEGISGYRLVGIGASFFGSGVINSIVLVLIATVLVKKNSKNLFFLFLSFLLISSIGILSSRTTVVGLVFSLMILLFNFKNSFKYLIFGSFVLLFLVTTLSFTNDRFNDLLEFGLGFLFDYKNSEAAQSVSILQSSFGIVPDSYKTWLIGDAKFGDQMSYYMGTDVGIYRIIFCTGLVGLFFYFLMQFYLISKIDNSYLKRVDKFLICIMLILLNFKGIASFFVILIIPYLLSLRKMKF